jgi:hypothetical protein
VNLGQVILGLVFPIQNPRPLITDQYLIVRLEAVIVVTRSEEAVVAKQLRVVEEPRLHLRAFIGGSEEGRRA